MPSRSRQLPVGDLAPELCDLRLGHPGRVRETAGDGTVRADGVFIARPPLSFRDPTSIEKAGDMVRGLRFLPTEMLAPAPDARFFRDFHALDALELKSRSTRSTSAARRRSA